MIKLTQDLMRIHLFTCSNATGTAEEPVFEVAAPALNVRAELSLDGRFNHGTA